jgi:hypothetical protein
MHMSKHLMGRDVKFLGETKHPLNHRPLNSTSTNVTGTPAPTRPKLLRQPGRPVAIIFTDTETNLVLLLLPRRGWPGQVSLHGKLKSEGARAIASAAAEGVSPSARRGVPE